MWFCSNKTYRILHYGWGLFPEVINWNTPAPSQEWNGMKQSSRRSESKLSQQWKRCKVCISARKCSPHMRKEIRSGWRPRTLKQCTPLPLWGHWDMDPSRSPMSSVTQPTGCNYQANGKFIMHSMLAYWCLTNKLKHEVRTSQGKYLT